ncbi:MAG: LLM class F420-dependent oxidoreductase [Candidatus Rokubacteria bacterium]|nr:LLM class F420-dependent oxidoreductase [Candidatus Rokubacteria bacterium]
MTKTGLACPFLHVFGADGYLDFIREVETRGYHTAWIGETAASDAIATMTLIASRTTTLSVASGVIPLQTRTPTVLAMGAATIARIAPGRVALGLGLSSPVIVGDWNGLRYSSSLEQLREAVHIMRGLLAGDRVTFDGKHYRVKNVRLLAPPPPTPPKIVLAALGPRALELAGEIADGVLLNWIAPETVASSIRHLEAGAKRAGRTLDGFEIAAFVRVSVIDEPEPARQALAREITPYATVPSYATFFRASGYAAEIEALQAAWKAGDRAGAVKHLSARVLEGLGVIGREDDCRRRFADFARSGLTMPVVVPFVPDTGGGDPRAALVRTMRAFP